MVSYKPHTDSIKLFFAKVSFSSNDKLLKLMHMFVYVVLYDLKMPRGIMLIMALMVAFAGFSGKNEKKNSAAFMYL